MVTEHRPRAVGAHVQDHGAGGVLQPGRATGFAPEESVGHGKIRGEDDRVARDSSAIGDHCGDPLP